MLNLKSQDERLAKLVFFTFAALTPLYLAFCQLGLYADGSYFLYTIMKHQAFMTYADPRFFTHVLSQSLTVSAINLGIKNNSILIYIHSFNLTVIPALIWWISLYKSKSEVYFWPFIAIYSVVYLNSSFFCIGEYNFAYAFVALSIAILLKTQTLSQFDSLTLLFSSVFLTRSYEAMGILGPLLIVLAISRLVRHDESRSAKTVLVLSCALFSYAIMIAVKSIFHHRDSTAVQNASNIYIVLENKQLMISFLVFFLYPFSFWLQSKKLAIILKFALVGLTILILSLPQTWATPEQHYLSRSLVAVVLICGVCLFLLLQFKFKPQPNVSPWPIPMALFVCLNFLMLYHGYHFSVFVKLFRAEITTHTGNIPFEQTSLEQHKAYGWIWTYPIMSNLLSQSPENAIIQTPKAHHGWVPEL